MQKFELQKSTFKIPEWALCYLANGVTDNLTPEETKLCRKFMAANRIHIFGPPESEAYLFHPNDVGGLACDVFDCDCLVLPTSEEIYKWLLRPYSCQYGAPMGQSNSELAHIMDWATRPHYDRWVYTDSGGYDKSGAYWGLGNPIRVRYLKDGSEWQFYNA